MSNRCHCDVFEKHIKQKCSQDRLCALARSLLRPSPAGPPPFCACAKLLRFVDSQDPGWRSSCITFLPCRVFFYISRHCIILAAFTRSAIAVFTLVHRKRGCLSSNHLLPEGWSQSRLWRPDLAIGPKWDRRRRWYWNITTRDPATGPRCPRISGHHCGAHQLSHLNDGSKYHRHLGLRSRRVGRRSACSHSCCKAIPTPEWQRPGSCRIHQHER